MTNRHALVREAPPARRVLVSRIGPIQANLAAAMAEPGESFRIVTYPSATSASTAASEFRKGRRKVPDNTTPDQWEFKSGQTADGEGFGVWARFLG